MFLAGVQTSLLNGDPLNVFDIYQRWLDAVRGLRVSTAGHLEDLCLRTSGGFSCAGAERGDGPGSLNEGQGTAGCLYLLFPRFPYLQCLIFPILPSPADNFKILLPSILLSLLILLSEFFFSFFYPFFYCPTIQNFRFVVVLFFSFFCG